MAIALVLAALVAATEHRTGSRGAATRALEGGTFGVLLPVIALIIVRVGCGGRRLEDALAPFARLGASRRPLALGLVLGAAAAAAVVGALLGAITPLVAHDPSVGSIGADALASAWIGALAGAAYAPLLALGSTFGARGGGAFVLFFLDLSVGASTTVAALPFPRSHALNLLGGVPPSLFESSVTQGQSVLSLVAIAVAATALAVQRCAP
jgi:hypothetical protein